MKSSKRGLAPQKSFYVACAVLVLSIVGARATPVVEPQPGIVADAQSMAVEPLSASLAGTAPVTWSDDIDASLARARLEDRLVFVDVYTDWCPWCERLNDETFADPRVARLLSGYVLLKVNPESSDEMAKFAASYAVVGFPTMLVVEGSGELVGAIRRFVAPSELMSRLEKITATRR